MAAKTKRKPTPKAIEREYQEELSYFVKIATQMAMHMEWFELAQEASLSVSTVKNLLLGDTKSPHHRTIFKVGRALGINVTVDKNKFRLSAT